jgi:hypothetical protein
MVTTLQCTVRLSMMELLLGLLAAISDELRVRAPGKPVSIKPLWLFESLIKLAQHDAYAESLRGLEEGNFVDVLSQMKTWGTLNVEDGGRAFIMSEQQASRQLGNVGRDHGLAAVEKLRGVVIHLLASLPKEG